jgi:hypothetical protein
MPARLRRTLRTTLSFYVPAGNSTAAAGNYTNMCVNTLYTPFNAGYPVNTAANTYSMHGSYVQGFSATSEPAGYTIFQTLYTLYKVMRYKITVRPQCATAADQFGVVLLPQSNEAIPSASAGYMNLLVLQSQPRAKYADVINGAKQTSLVHSEGVHITLGKRAEQWMNIDSVPFNSAPTTADLAYCGLFFQPLNGSANQAVITCTIILEQEVEFSGLVAQIN